MTIITDVPQTGPIEQTVQNGTSIIRPPWFAWFKQVFLTCFSVQDSGTTAQRPSNLPQPQQLWIGRRYFDTTVDQPVWWDGTKWVTWSASSGTGGVAPGDGMVMSWAVSNNHGEAPMGLTITNSSGVLSTETEADSDIVSAQQKLIYTQSNTSSNEGPWWTSPGIWRGSVSGSGGFTLQSIWGTRGTFSSDTSSFFGLTNTVSWGSFDPSSNTNDVFGMGANASDTNWQFFNGTNGSSPTKTGTSVAKGPNQMFYQTLSCTANASSMHARVVQVTGYGTSTVLLDQSFSSNLPRSNISLIILGLHRSATTLSKSWYSFHKLIKPLNPAYS